MKTLLSSLTRRLLQIRMPSLTRRNQILALTLALLTLTVSFVGWRAQAGRWLLSRKPARAAKANAHPASPVREEIARKLKTQSKVKVELFVMSQCPFGVKAEEAMASVLDEFGEQVDFQLRFIAAPASGSFNSLHGQPEVEEDIRQVVMAEQFPDQYFDYVVARAANYRSSEWQGAAAAAGIDVSKVERLTRSETGKRLFTENIRRANELRIGASPTLYLDGEKYQGRIIPLAPAAAAAKPLNAAAKSGSAAAAKPVSAAVAKPRSAAPGLTPARILSGLQAGEWGYFAWQSWGQPLWAKTSAAARSGANWLSAVSAPRVVLPTITATKSATLATDLNGNGVVNPGDTLMYSVLLNNTGNTDALNVVFTDTLNANLTFVPGSLSATPIAQNDSYTTRYNKKLEVAGSQTDANATFVMGSVRNNDIDPMGGALTITTLTNSATTQNGSVTLSSTGTFLYTPPTNYAGQDSFTYTATNAQGKSDTATVTVTIIPNNPPTAVAIGTPQSGTVPLTVAFSSAGSSDSDGSIVAYAWDFGDGSPSATAANPSHTYAAPGTYTASLTVTDNDGATNTATVTITVNPQCVTASDCGMDTACKTYTCNAGQCGVNYTAAGTVVANSTPGDCHSDQCDGAGNITVGAVDNTDKPVDNNSCTLDVCTNGVPSNPPASAGTGCSQNGGSVCNGAGACVQCVNNSACPSGQVCSSGVCIAAPPVCGNGIKEGSEQCDDGNTASGDGCSATCSVETGFTCTGLPSVCATTCGDGIKAGSEACDDGNTVSGDGCSSTCQLEIIPETEPNDTCATANGPYTIPTTPTGILLSGSLNPVGDVDWYAFNIPFTADVWFETFDATGPGSCSPSTVNTVIQLFNSDCATALSMPQDQGGINNCSRLNPTTQPTATTHLAAGTYFLKVSNAGTNTYNYRLQAKYVAVCGNSIKEGAEECDGGPGCAATCDRIPICGDGFIDGPETCDDGNTVSGDGCASTCAVEPGYTCTGSPSVCSPLPPSCNDMVKNGNETSVDCGGSSCPSCANGKTCNVNSDCASNHCTGGVCTSSSPAPSPPSPGLLAQAQQWLRSLFTGFTAPRTYGLLASSFSPMAAPPLLAWAYLTAAPPPARTMLVNSKGEYTIVSSTAIPTSFAGETITVNGTGSGFTLPAGKSTTIMFKATISPSFTGATINNQASVSGTNFTTTPSNLLMTPVTQGALTVKLSDPIICTGENNTLTVHAEVTNPNAFAANLNFNAALVLPLSGVPGSCISSAGTCTITANNVNVMGLIPANQNVIIDYKVIVANGTPQGTRLCIDSTASFNNALPDRVQACTDLNCPPAPANVRVSDQKAGSVLVFPYYISNTATKKDTRLTLSNVGDKATTVHLLFIDGASCNQADQFLCLTPNASFSFKTSEYDPEMTGWVLAVAVDNTGVPMPNNALIGNAFVVDGEYVDNYGAESFRANSPALAAVNNLTATLFFDGSSYDAVPNQLAVEIQSPADAPGQRVVTVGLQGDLTTSQMSGASQVGTGQIFNGNEKPFGSFSNFLSGKCQAIATISTTNPRVPNGMNVMIPSGQAGSMKFTVGASVGLLMTPRTSPWRGIRALHKTAQTTTTITIPVIRPMC